MKYLWMTLVSFSVFGAGLNTATEAIQNDLKAVNKALVNQQSQIFGERQELTRATMTAREALVQNSQASLIEEIESLQKELVKLERELKNQQNILDAAQANATQLRREFPTLLPQLNQGSFDAELASQDKLLDAGQSDSFYQSYFASLSKVATQGSQVLRRKIAASDAQGNIVEMDLLSLGYVQFFLSSSKQAGIGNYPEGDHTPRLSVVAGLKSKLAQDQAASLPIDFSDGLVFKDEAREKSLTDHIKKGGIIIYPLLLLGILCFIAGLVKTVHLYLVRSSYDDKVAHLVSLIREAKFDEAQTFVDQQKDPIKRLLQEALSHRDIKREDLEERLNESVLSQLPRLDSFLSVLSVSAGAAPLLGLLGTVMGIIKTFEMIGIYGTGDANRMAGGISEALVTTEIGLMVAIPALIWHAVLNRRLRKIMSNLDKAILSFINAIKLQEKYDEVD